MTDRQIGPNVRRLIIRKMSLLVIPAGSGKDSLALGAEIFTDRNKFQSVALEASAFVQAAIDVMKTAPDNPYGDDDEAIAGAILKGIEERKAKQ
jgi:hypothetical protein